MYKNKRGVSPVIATVLLVLLALVLALIIFLWVRSWLGEKVQKDLGEGMILIEEVCKSVGFKAEVSRSFTSGGTVEIEVAIENTKNVPIYGIQLMKVAQGSKKTIGTAKYTPSGTDIESVRAGQSYIFSTAGPSSHFGATTTKVNTLISSDSVLIRPMILGKTESSSETKEHICTNDEVSVTTEVIGAT